MTILPLAAAELVVRDVRGALLIRPTAFDFEVVSSSFTGSGEDSFESGTGFELGARYSLARTGSALGLVLGGDIAYDAYTYDGDGSLATYGGRAAVGLGWAATDRWTLLLEAGGGYGFAAFDLPASTANAAVEVSGGGLVLDGRVSTIYRFARRWAVHAHVGYMSSSYDLSDSGVDVTLDQTGLYAGIGFTFLFSTSPTRLE